MGVSLHVSLDAPATERGVPESLAKIIESHRAEIAQAWLSGIGEDSRTRYPEIERYLRSLVSGLHEVFKEDDWSLTQTVIDGLAERRARLGFRLELGVLKALLAGRHAIRPFFDEGPAGCDEVLLDALHECVFRFCESYQGNRMANENDRVNNRVIKSLVMALEARDHYTTGHSISVALLSQRTAEALGTPVDPHRAYLAGLLHDVGKVGVPDRILAKTGELNEHEWEIIQAHPITGANILRPIRLYPDVVSAVRSHHENYDGSGYPDALAGDDIPPLARVIRVVDSFDAMTSARAYRGGYSVDETIDELVRRAGTRYDTDVVEALVKVVTSPGTVRELSLASLQIDLNEFSAPQL